MTSTLAKVKSQRPKPGNYKVSRHNATSYGLHSSGAFLPGEDPVEYEALHAKYAVEYPPQGPAEEHYVKDLADTEWRGRRLRMAEAGAFREALRQLVGAGSKNTYANSRLAFPNYTDVGSPDEEDLVDLVALPPDEAETTLHEIEAELSLVSLVIKELRANDDVEPILDTLPDDLRQAYSDELRNCGHDLDGSTGTDDEEIEVEPGITFTRRQIRSLELYSILKLRQEKLAKKQNVLARYDEIHQAAHCIVAAGPVSEKVARAETQLDRKFERTLKNLLVLKKFKESAVTIEID